MALTESKEIDQITVTKDGTVYYRETTIIFRDDIELTKQYHRTSIAPGSDLSDIPTNVANICNVVWTQEVIAAYQEAQNSVSQG